MIEHKAILDRYASVVVGVFRDMVAEGWEPALASRWCVKDTVANVATWDLVDDHGREHAISVVQRALTDELTEMRKLEPAPSR